MFRNRIPQIIPVEVDKPSYQRLPLPVRSSENSFFCSLFFLSSPTQEVVRESSYLGQSELLLLDTEVGAEIIDYIRIDQRRPSPIAFPSVAREVFDFVPIKLPLPLVPFPLFSLLPA